MNRNNHLIYFNNNRTTRVDPEVHKSMLLYPAGEKTPDPGVEEASREALSRLIGCNPSEIIFTGGTTESVQLALRAIYALMAPHKGRHIITNTTEHFAVLDCCEELKKQGAEITYLGVNQEGLIDPEELKAAIQPGTIAVSIMAANNETGVIQPLEKISEICAEKDIFLFSDASQFVGKMRCDVQELGLDCMAFGAHKMYGPEGIGLLYLKQAHKDLRDYITQQHSDTSTLAQKAGFARAAELSLLEYWDMSTHISKLKNYFEHQLLDIEGLRINGSTRYRLYNTSNLTFPDTKNVASLLSQFDFAGNISKPSYVLKAMGLSDEDIKNSFRFSFGKYNTLDEVKQAVEAIMAL